MEKIIEPAKFSLLGQAKRIFLIFAGFFVFFFAILVVVQALNFIGQTFTFLSQNNTLLAALSPSPAVSPALAPESPVPTQVGFLPVLKADSLEIQKLGLDVPLVSAKSPDLKSMTEDLDRGTVIYPGSSQPGQSGQLLVLGHSAPAWWPKIRYDTVFSKLNDLDTGDEILVNLDQKQYRYRVTKKIFLKKGDPVPESDSGKPHQLYLITCWPPGRDIGRLAVEAVLF